MYFSSQMWTKRERIADRCKHTNVFQWGFYFAVRCLLPPAFTTLKNNKIRTKDSPQMEQFMSLPSTESYSRRTSITPSSSSVRMCGVLVELQWLGNLAFFLRPPSSTVSITSLASTVVSGMLSDEHQNVTIKQPLNRRNLANSDLVGGTRKKIFCIYSTRSQKYELFAFHNNNSEDFRHLIGSHENNGM